MDTTRPLTPSGNEAGTEVPPCFIIVCNNTATSKLVYDYISGFERINEDGSTTLQNGRFELFRNFDEYGNRLPIPHTLLIDSQQLESGDKLSDEFRKAAAPLIERFRRERGGAIRQHPRCRQHYRTGTPSRGDEHGWEEG